MPMAAGANTPAQEQRDPARIRPGGQLRAVTTESDMSQERVRFGHRRQVLVEHRPIPHPGRQPHRKRPHPDLLSQQASVPLPATSTTAREICCRTGPCRRSTQRHTTGQLTPEKVGGCCKGDSNPGPTHRQSAVPQDPMTPAELQTSLVRRTIRHMATYAYRCAEHGDFDISRPMGMAAATSRCKICNKEAVGLSRAHALLCTTRTGGRDRPHSKIARRARSGVGAAATACPGAQFDGDIQPRAAAPAATLSMRGGRR